MEEQTMAAAGAVGGEQYDDSDSEDEVTVDLSAYTLFVNFLCGEFTYVSACD